jgi:hypothetical protein
MDNIKMDNIVTGMNLNKDGNPINVIKDGKPMSVNLKFRLIDFGLASEIKNKKPNITA